MATTVNIVLDDTLVNLQAGEPYAVNYRGQYARLSDGSAIYYIDWNGNLQLSSFHDAVTLSATSSPMVTLSGQELDFNISHKIDSYTSLRAADGTLLPDVIIVEDFGTIVNAQSFTTEGGVFLKDKAASHTENGGTHIVAADGTVWSRVWDRVNVKPEWWEVGGYDTDGNPFVDKFTLGGCRFESDRLSFALEVGDALHLQEREYICEDDFTIPEGDSKIIGNGATIKRGDVVFSTLTSATSGNTIQVDDASGFYVGMDIIVLDASATNNGKAFNENSLAGGTVVRRITDITGNTLTITADVGGSFSIGDTIFHRFSTIGNNDVGPYGSLYIENLIIDGNRANNDLSYDWRLFHDLAPGDAEGEFVMVNVTVQEGQTTPFFPNKGNFRNCTFKDCNGAGVHIGSTTSTGISFENCKFYNLIEIPGDLANHTANAIEYSVGVDPAYVNNCEFIDVGGGVIGPIGENTFMAGSNNMKGLTFTNNYVELCRGQTLINVPTTDRTLYNIVWENNYHINSGDFTIQGRSVYTGLSNYSITFNNNTWINGGRMFFRNVSNVFLTNNKWYTVEDDVNYVAWTTATSGQEAMIQFLDFDRITISNNFISGPPTNNINVRNGVLLQHGDIRRRDASGVLTDYLYAQDIKVINNTIANFSSGLSCQQQNARLFTFEYQTVGWIYQGNTVFVTKDIVDFNNTFGIHVEPGVLCIGNQVYAPAGARFGIMVAGVLSGSGQESKLQGGICINNIVYKLGTGAIVLGYQGSTSFASNMICKGNIHNDAIVTNRAQSFVLDNNTQLNTTNFPDQTALVIPEYQNWYENKSQY